MAKQKSGIQLITSNINVQCKKMSLWDIKTGIRAQL